MLHFSGPPRKDQKNSRKVFCHSLYYLSAEAEVEIRTEATETQSRVHLLQIQVVEVTQGHPPSV